MSAPSVLTARHEAEREWARHVLRRHGYSEGDLDYLLFAGPGTPRGDDVPELQQAVELLARLRATPR
jgi:hypothetical protein